ncbi:MAG: hypothetical protein ACYSUN_03300 [Planctomycetota bacterium]|jgi:hypothetical protein
MIYKNDLNGSAAPIVHKYQVGATDLGRAGVPAQASLLPNVDGVLPATTTACAFAVGVTLDYPGAQLTAQQTGNAETERLVSIIVNPNALYYARLSGGATTGTALTINTNTVVDLTGLLLTLGLSTDYDDGYVWGYEGANAGAMRKVTAVDATNEVPIVPFRYDIAVGDTFLACTFGPGEDAGVQLTSVFDEVDASGDNQGADNFRCVRLHGGDLAGEGTTRSWALLAFQDHLYGGAGVVA